MCIRMCELLHHRYCYYCCCVITYNQPHTHAPQHILLLFTRCLCSLAAHHSYYSYYCCLTLTLTLCCMSYLLIDCANDVLLAANKRSVLLSATRLPPAAALALPPIETHHHHPLSLRLSPSLLSPFSFLHDWLLSCHHMLATTFILDL